MLLDISTWWAALQLPEKVYWVIAIPSTVLLVVQIIMTFMGSEGDDIDSDMDTELDHGDAGWQFFTYKNTLGFFTVFSWTGLGFLKMGVGILI